MTQNRLLTCGLLERPAITRTLLDTFPARLAAVVAVLGETEVIKQAIEQFAKVSRCAGSYERTNGKTFYNLFQSAAKLETMILELEHRAGYHGVCANCYHQKHDAGECRQCGCGEADVIGRY